MLSGAIRPLLARCSPLQDRTWPLPNGWTPGEIEMAGSAVVMEQERFAVSVCLAQASMPWRFKVYHWLQAKGLF